MLVSAEKIKDGNKKNELILYAQSIACKAVYCEGQRGMSIQVDTKKQKKLIETKIKELGN